MSVGQHIRDRSFPEQWKFIESTQIPTDSVLSGLFINTERPIHKHILLTDS